jgi:hypothetical protein
MIAAITVAKGLMMKSSVSGGIEATIGTKGQSVDVASGTIETGEEGGEGKDGEWKHASSS